MDVNKKFLNRMFLFATTSLFEEIKIQTETKLLENMNADDDDFLKKLKYGANIAISSESFSGNFIFSTQELLLKTTIPTKIVESEMDAQMKDWSGELLNTFLAYFRKELKVNHISIKAAPPSIFAAEEIPLQFQSYGKKRYKESNIIKSWYQLGDSIFCLQFSFDLKLPE